MATKKSKASQNFVPVKEIRDGIIILKDNSMRAVVMVSSINFSLKSSDEKEAVIMQFQSFLNTLSFPVQIYIQSRKFNINPYINLLQKQYEKQKNDLLKIQIKEYVDFVGDFTEKTNIMTKNFFIVIPYTPSFIKSGSGFGLFNSKKDDNYSEDDFETHLSQLEQRISMVEQGLVRTGVRLARLTTEEVTELLYMLFNPDETEKPVNI